MKPRITHIDRAIIRGYFRQRYGTRKVAQRGTEFQLPFRGRSTAGNQQPPLLQTASLPNELERKLSALAAGYQRVRAGSDILLIESTGGTVIDVLQDIHTTI